MEPKSKTGQEKKSETEYPASRFTRSQNVASGLTSFRSSGTHREVSEPQKPTSAERSRCGRRSARATSRAASAARASACAEEISGTSSQVAASGGAEVFGTDSTAISSAPFGSLP